ncbi:hypothetical protein BpHYR1_041438 [Brachionus plicatilis]|uniref:Uncharacterized protein n=1 Tax=Brachionus plicatilis TaxID=10195 RepID=A0A3M7QMN4_BRAPC|nr:hypothetical protein BpHYR1_041438 [Brachionus plicatilis]
MEELQPLVHRKNVFFSITGYQVWNRRNKISPERVEYKKIFLLTGQDRSICYNATIQTDPHQTVFLRPFRKTGPSNGLDRPLITIKLRKKKRFLYFPAYYLTKKISELLQHTKFKFKNKQIKF